MEIKELKMINIKCDECGRKQKGMRWLSFNLAHIKDYNFNNNLQLDWSYDDEGDIFCYECATEYGFNIYEDKIELGKYRK